MGTRLRFRTATPINPHPTSRLLSPTSRPGIRLKHPQDRNIPFSAPLAKSIAPTGQLELQVNVAGASKPVALYISDFSQLDLSAIGFTPKKEMDPCHELNGMKAKMIYAESSDKTVDGQIVSVELHK